MIDVPETLHHKTEPDRQQATVRRCTDDDNHCKRDHAYCLVCLRDANEHNWNHGVDVDCPPGVTVRVAR